jgi:O-methyltransferase
MLKPMIRRVLRKMGYEIRRHAGAEVAQRVDLGLYRPLYSPWESDKFTPYYSIAAPRTLVSRDRCYVLERLFRQTLPVTGEIFECGVYKGGTAALLRALLDETGCAKKLYLFDTFEGMPATDSEKDWHKKGDFSDTAIEEVRTFVGGGDNCIFKKGFIPDTFRGLSDIKVSFCHIDVDIYKSIMDSLEFVWPRMPLGGAIVFDDYGFPTCPGALQAVDDFFRQKEAVPLCLHTGQAIVFKGPPNKGQ